MSEVGRSIDLDIDFEFNCLCYSLVIFALRIFRMESDNFCQSVPAKIIRVNLSYTFIPLGKLDQMNTHFLLHLLIPGTINTINRKRDKNRLHLSIFYPSVFRVESDNFVNHYLLK